MRPCAAMTGRPCGSAVEGPIEFKSDPVILPDLITRVRTCFFFFQAEDGIRDKLVTGVQTCALPILLGLQILGVSSLAAGFNFVVTILNLRAPGLKMMRLPTFSWMTLVTNFLIITAFPVITVGLLFLMFDRFFGTHFYVREAGATPVLWQHLFWLFGHPEVYILILPAMGIVSDVLPTFSRKPLFGYTVVVYSGILIGFMSWGVWSHHMFSVGLGPIADSVFAATTMLIAVPTGVKIFNWIATLWGGDIRGTTGSRSS